MAAVARKALYSIVTVAGGHFRCVGLLAWFAAALAVAGPVQAAGTAETTYNGTDGTADNVFVNCVGCHSPAGLTTPYLDTHAALTTSFTPSTGTGIGSCGAGSQPVYQCAKTLIDANLMPFGCTPGVDCLTTAQKNLLTAWISGGRDLNAAPFVQTPTASSIGKYSVTLNTSVSENGAESAFSFHYKKSVDVSYTTATVTSGEEGDAGTDSDGNAGAKAINKSISLSGAGNCGTTYNYFARGVNSVNTTNSALGSNFATLACPSISNISNQSINEDSSTGALAFTLGDGVTTCGLTVTASSSNTTLIPNANLALAGSCAARSITVTPVANLSGSSTITVNVSDGTTTDSDTFVVTVNAVNDTPSISDISNQGTNEDTSIGPIAFTISDLETAAASLSVSASSSNQTLVPDGNISFGGSGGSRNVTLMPAADQTGSATITITVSDGVANSSDTFTLLVSGVNDLPTISNISNQTSNEDNSNIVGFTIADTETAAGSLTVTASSSNTTLIPNANLVFGGSGGSRTLTATPVTNASGSSTITVTVRDELLAAASDIYVLTITAVNDAPVLSAIGSQSVTELSPFALATTVTDPDDADDGSGALSYSLLSAPAGMTINALGNIAWTPGEDTASTYPITVRVADGGEDGAAASTTAFTLTVQKLDTDADTVADYDDNCPSTANTDQANNDADTEGDVCDSDDDNDGLPDSVELARGLDPFDPSDAAGDLDGDGLTNLEEYLNCVANADPVCDDIVVDSVAPVITTNGDLIIAATGYVTDAGETATAEDSVDGSVTVSADVRGPFRPGLHLITWTAQDAAGNIATAAQEIRVLPRAEIATTLIVGEGQTVRVPVQLNGAAPSYPVFLVYSVNGTSSAADHTLAAGTINIASGTEAVLEFATLLDAAAEADETIEIRLYDFTDFVTLGDGRLATVTLIDRAIAPIVDVESRQGGDVTQVIYTDFGEVEIAALAVDANNDSLTYQWQLSDDGIASTTSGNLLHFDPSGLAVGTYSATVVVNDAGHQVTRTIDFHVAGVGPVLTDSADADGDGIDDLAEGLADSDGDGVLDYRDPVDSAHQLQISANTADSMQRLLITEPGLQLHIGAHALARQRPGARISSADVLDDNDAVIADADYAPVGEIYDFRISGLNEAHPDARVVIPLLLSIPPDAVYRKLLNGRWQSFSTATGDEIHSATLLNGRCPALDDPSWQTGLNRSDQCIRLRIRDGGVNDADGSVNGAVADPGAVSLAKAEPSEGEPEDGPNGGGGVMATGSLLTALLALIAMRRRSSRRRSA